MGRARTLVASLVATAMLATMAQPALAVDDSFHGRYFATWTTTQGTCSNDGYAVRIRVLGSTSRRYDPAGTDRGAVLRYQEGERYPWQFTGPDGGISLRYRAFTDYARGIAWQEECTWRVFLGRSDAPSN